MGDNYEWELSKENIQPLKHGRNISSLVSALTVNEDHHKQMRNEQRKQMELAIMSYDGNDPLDLWSKYINWVEESYPQGGKEGDLLTILEKCLEKLRDWTQYKSDVRLLEVYLRYLDLTENNAEWFQQLYGAGYFHKLANFYVCWADVHEMNSNFKEGTKVYQLGIQNNAEPLVKLEEAFKHYQARVANAIFKTMTNPDQQQPSPTEAPSRNAFGDLETSERRAPTLRTGTQVRRAPFQNRVLPGPKSATNKPLFIHQDDENSPVSSTVTAPLISAKSAIPIHSIMKAENALKATKWNESSGVVNEVVHQAPQATFQVHIDDSAPLHHHHQHSQSTKKPADNFTSALKDKAPPTAKLNPHTLFERENPKMKMMCDLDKILVANREFSFEEIRRQIYERNGRVPPKTPLKTPQKVDVLKTPSSGRKTNYPPALKPNERWHCSIEAMYQDGKEFTFEHLRALAYATRKPKIETRVTQPLKTPEQELRVNEINEQNNVRDSRVDAIAQPIVVRPATQPPEMVEKKPVIVEDKVAKVDASVQTDIFGLDFDIVLVPKKRVVEPKTPSPVKDHKQTDSGPSSSQPSPTVNTKQALSSVKSWFNSSVLVPESKPVESKPVKKSLFAVFKDPTIVDEPQEEPRKPFAVFSDEPDRADFKKPFAIFDENAPVDKENCQPKLKPRKPLSAIAVEPKVEPHQEEEVEDCKENVPPKGFVQETVKRQLSGILVPSIDIPCDPVGLVTEEVAEPPVDEVLSINRKTSDNHLGVPRALFNDEEDQTRCYFAPLAPIEDFTVPSAVAFANNLHIQSTPLISRSQLPQLEEPTFNLPGKKAVQPTLNQEAKPVPRGLSPIDEGSREYYSSSASSAGTLTHHSRLSVGRSLHDAGRVYPGHFNPFDNEHRLGQLSQLAMPVEQRLGFDSMAGRLPWLKTNSNIQLGRDCYHVKQMVGQGCYAKVYEALDEEKRRVVLKVQESDGVWEFYVSSELQRRLAGAPTANCVMKVDRGYFYESGSILVTDYLNHGTLLDLVNHYRLRNSSMPEALVFHFVLQLLSLVRDMHECNVLHADIKADNIMLQSANQSLTIQPEEWTVESLLKEDVPTLKLIDLGRCLDLALYPDKTSFMYVFQDDKCPEMRDGKTWSYQLDYYGIATTVFTLLMGVHCKVVNVDGQWRTPNLKRGHNPVWRDLTTALLNAPPNAQLDLLHFRQVLADQLISTIKLREYNDRIRELERYLNHKH